MSSGAAPAAQRRYGAARVFLCFWVTSAVDTKTIHVGFAIWRKNGSWECQRLGPGGTGSNGHSTGLKVEMVAAWLQATRMKRQFFSTWLLTWPECKDSKMCTHHVCNAAGCWGHVQSSWSNELRLHAWWKSTHRRENQHVRVGKSS